jgi:hypothetical protein
MACICNDWKHPEGDEFKDIEVEVNVCKGYDVTSSIARVIKNYGPTFIVGDTIDFDGREIISFTSTADPEAIFNLYSDSIKLQKVHSCVGNKGFSLKERSDEDTESSFSDDMDSFIDNAIFGDDDINLIM